MDERFRSTRPQSLSTPRQVAKSAKPGRAAFASRGIDYDARLEEKETRVTELSKPHHYHTNANAGSDLAQLSQTATQGNVHGDNHYYSNRVGNNEASNYLEQAHDNGIFQAEHQTNNYGGYYDSFAGEYDPQRPDEDFSGESTSRYSQYPRTLPGEALDSYYEQQAWPNQWTADGNAASWEQGAPLRPSRSRVPDLFSLTRHNRYDQVEALLDSGLSIHLRDRFGNQVLHIAAQNGLKRIAKLALRRGADINAQNSRGNTALHYAYAYQFGESLGAYLISKGADPLIRNYDNLLCTEMY